MNIEQNKIASRRLGFLPKFQSKKVLEIQKYPRVDDSEGKKRLHRVLTARFTVVDFLCARNNVFHNRAKLRRLLCHCFVNSGFPRKANFAYTVNPLINPRGGGGAYFFQALLRGGLNREGGLKERGVI